LECAHEKALWAGLQMATYARFLDWRAFSPRGVYFTINWYIILGFTPTVAWVISNDTISNEDCRVFVLRSRSTSHLIGPILSHQVIYSHQVLQIQMSYTQTYIHLFMHISIHAYTIGTRISFLRNCINHPESLLLTISQKCHLLACRITRRHSSFFMSRVSSPGLSDYETSLKFLNVKHLSLFFRITEGQNVIPRFIGRRNVKNIIPRFIGRRNVKHLSPFSRITEGQKPSFPGLLDYEISKMFPRFVGLRKVKSVIPRFIGRRNIKNIIPRFIGRRNVKHHSPIYRITEGQKCHSPLYQKTGYWEYHSPVCRKMEYQKYHLLVCRITRCHSSQIPHFPQKCHPSLSGQKMSLINHFKWLVLNNGHLEFTFCLCFKWLALNNGQLEFTFCLCFKWLALNNGQLEFTFYDVSSGKS